MGHGRRPVAPCQEHTGPHPPGMILKNGPAWAPGPRAHRLGYSTRPARARSEDSRKGGAICSNRALNLEKACCGSTLFSPKMQERPSLGVLASAHLLFSHLGINRMPVLTRKLIESCRTPRGAFTSATVRAFGLDWNSLVKGWPYRLVGTFISDEQYATALRGARVYVKEKTRRLNEAALRVREDVPECVRLREASDALTFEDYCDQTVPRSAKTTRNDDLDRALALDDERDRRLWSRRSPVKVGHLPCGRQNSSGSMQTQGEMHVKRTVAPTVTPATTLIASQHA